MTAAWTKVLLILPVLARPFAWPGALDTDGRAVADLPEPGATFRPSTGAPRPTADAQRLVAIDRLVTGHGLDAAMPFLLPLLADREPAVRLYAARLLARADTPAASAAAVAWIITPAVPLVDRGLGLDVLSHAATLSPTARAAVEQAVRDPEAATRARALDVLADHPIGPSLPVVLGALDDDNREVRLEAIRLAGAAGDPRAALPLLDRLDDGDRQIRLQAIAELGLLRDLRVVPALVRVTGEGTLDERTAALDALGALKAPAAVVPLVALARRKTDDLARHALLALGEIATPAAIGSLVAALRIPPVPEEAQVGLRHAGGSAVAPLLAEVDNGTPSSTGLAAMLLGEIGDRRATRPLAMLIEGGAAGAPTVLPALEALARLRDPAALPALARAAESSDVEIRRGAFAALLATADPRSIALLDGGLADPDSQVRTLSARLAAAIDAHGAAPVLAARFADADPGVRRAAAEALAQVADASTRPVVAMLAALTRSEAPARDNDETAAIGDALEATVSEADADVLAEAFASARGNARTAIARGLAAAHGERPLSDRGLIDRLVAALADGGQAALAAADALAVARVPAAAVSALARAFGDAESMVRARLCEAIASTPDGGAWLAALLTAPDEPPEVRAAAAWAARGRSEPRAALEVATRDRDGAVALNARAALSAAGRPGRTWTAVRLRAPDGAPLVGRWVTMADAGGVAIEALTDSLGVARVGGLTGAGAIVLRAGGLTPWGGPRGEP